MNPFAKPAGMAQDEYDAIMRRVQLEGDEHPETTKLPCGMTVAEARAHLMRLDDEQRPKPAEKPAPKKRAKKSASSPTPPAPVQTPEPAAPLADVMVVTAVHADALRAEAAEPVHPAYE